MNAIIPVTAAVIKTGSHQSPVNLSDIVEQKIILDDVKEEENLYSEEYYDRMMKRMFEDPQINKKQMLNKLFTYLQSQD